MVERSWLGAGEVHSAVHVLSPGGVGVLHGTALAVALAVRRLAELLLRGHTTHWKLGGKVRLEVWE